MTPVAALNGLLNPPVVTAYPAVVAAAVWTLMKEQGLTFDEILKVCATLLVNVADKTEGSDYEVTMVTLNHVRSCRARRNRGGADRE